MSETIFYGGLRLYKAGNGRHGECFILAVAKITRYFFHGTVIITVWPVTKAVTAQFGLGED